MKKKNLKNKKKGSSTSKTTQGAQKTPNFYNLYKRYSKQDKITEYFENPRYEPYHYVSYLELLEIIGEDPQRSQFPSIRKNILKIHCEYQNAALDTLYKYIYTPLALRSLYCLGKTQKLNLEFSHQKDPEFLHPPRSDLFRHQGLLQLRSVLPQPHSSHPFRPIHRFFGMQKRGF